LIEHKNISVVRIKIAPRCNYAAADSCKK